MSASSSLDGTFEALVDPTRRGAIRLLQQGPLRAGELAEGLGMSKPAMTRHLRVLRESGLVLEEEQEGDGRVRLYRLQPAPFHALREWLDEIEASWSLQLSSFKKHAERTRGPAAKRGGGQS